VIDRAELDRWMAAAAEGDRDAVAPLFHALWPVVVRYATRLVGDPGLAEDCAQDALAQLFGQLDRYDRSRDALTWALTIATWRCRTVRRQRVRRGEHAAADEDAPAGEGEAFDGAAVIEHRDLVRAALATLETLGARDIEAITIAVTDRGDAPVAAATFRKRLERALARLRASWRSRHGTL
jgi:RNA polymerase sigma-70 factor (ECF subfamily)